VSGPRKLSAGLNAEPGSTYGGCTRFLRPGPGPPPQGWFPILALRVPAEEPDEVSARRRADPGRVRVSLTQRAA
jgi:hypothetical protein